MHRGELGSASILALLPWEVLVLPMAMLWRMIPCLLRGSVAARVAAMDCCWVGMATSQAHMAVFAWPGEAPILIKLPTDFRVGKWW